MNSQGGFLRKASTTIYYLRRQQQQHFSRALSQIGRLDIFRDLPQEEIQQLAEAVTGQDYPEGMIVYRQNDPSSYLFIVEKGEVELRDPNKNMRVFQRLQPYEIFGHMGFLTGAPRPTVAVTTADTRLWVLTKPIFESLLKESTALSGAMQRLLASSEIETYLQTQQGMAPTEAHTWVEHARMSIQTSGTLPAATQVQRHEQEFSAAVSHIRRVPIFQHLPPEDIQRLAMYLFSKTHEKGHTFFHAGELAGRMYIIEHGEVTLIDPKDKTRSQEILGDHDAFGAMSFLNNADHTVTAVATAEATTVWVLRKRDFNTLLAQSRPLVQAVQQFLQHEQEATYLEQQQHVDPHKASRWVQKAVSNMDAGKLIPSASEMADTVKGHKGAALAIWLGILLDGIPESLVIGASLIHDHVSLSLIAGLFISNYPEALSSSVGMRQQGLSFPRVLVMWTSLMLITGLLAAFGNLFFVGAAPSLFTFMQGLAAGAMLTMIAETMLPEAYFKGGAIVGFTTLLGFLAAIFFKTLE